VARAGNRSYIGRVAGYPLRGIGFLRIVAVVAAAGIAAVATDIVQTGWGQVLILALLTAGLLAFAVWRRADRRLPFLADPMVLICAFFAQYFVIGPISLPIFDWHVLVSLPVELVVGTMLAFIFMFLCFFAAYQSKLGPIVARMLPDFRGGRLKLPGRVAESVILFGSIFGCVAFLYNHKFLEAGYGQMRVSGLWGLPFITLILGTILMGWRLADSPKVSRLDWAVFGALMLIEIPFYAIVVGVRSRLFFLFFGLYTVSTMRRGVLRVWRWATVPLLVVLLIFFAIWGSVRTTSLRDLAQGRLDTRVVSRAPVQGYFVSVAEPFAAACMVREIFPAVEPHRHGRTLMVTLLGFIPRAWWPDKPVGIGKEVTRFTDGIYYDPLYGHSLTVTFLGDFWVNGGWLGVIVGGLAFGLLARTLVDYSAHGMEQDGVQRVPARVLIAALFAVTLVEVRSDFATFLSHWGINGPPLLLSLLTCRLDYSTDRGTSPGLAAEPVRKSPPTLALPRA